MSVGTGDHPSPDEDAPAEATHGWGQESRVSAAGDLAKPFIHRHGTAARTSIYAAYIIGFIQSAVGTYGSTTYALPVLYLVIVLVLTVRPYGLAGKPQEARL